MKKKKIMISFQEGGENGGPYTSHKRIMHSELQDTYEFIPYIIPRGRIGVMNVRLLKNLIGQIRSANPDVVHIHGLQLAGFYYALAAFLCHKKIILVVRGSSNEALDFPKWKKRIVNILEIWTLLMSDLVYGVSDYVCRWDIVTKYAGERLYGTIYNMMQIEELPDDSTREKIRADLNILREDVVVVSTGRITEEKGFEILCKAIVNLRENSSLKFLIVGDGSYLEEFKQIIDGEELADRVIFTGYQKDVTPFLKAADIFVICSLHETLCNSLIEAGAVGLPLIAPAIGGLPEIVKPNNTGILLKENSAEYVADAINLLSENEKLRWEYGNKAKEHIENTFAPNVIIGKIKTLYEKYAEEE